MKRTLFTCLVLAAVGICLLVSCAVQNNVPGEGDGIAYIRFGRDDRAFNADYDIQEYDNLYWFYTAQKTDSYGKTGETTDEVPVTADKNESGAITTVNKGLSGTIGPFSQGDWKFTLKAYAALTDNKPDTSKLVYQNDGDITATLRGGETKSIPAEVKPAGDTGSLKFDGAYFKWQDSGSTAPLFKIEAYGIDKKVTYILTNDTSITGTNVFKIALGIFEEGKGYPIKYVLSDTAITDIISVPVDYYTCKITAYINGDVTKPVAEDASFGFRIYGGATTVVSGDLTEKADSYASFDVKKTAIQSFTASSTAETKIEVAVAPKTEAYDSTEESKKTNKSEVAFEAGALAAADATYCLSAETLSAETASDAFTITADEGSGTAAVYGSIKLTLDAINGTTSTSVTDFGDKKVTVTTYIEPGLDQNGITVKYTGATGSQPTDVTYNSTTGKVTFKTTHFSEFVVVSKKAAPVYNKSQNRYYSTLEDAVKNLGDTTELELKSDVTVSKTIEIKQNLSLDLGGKTIKSSNRVFFIHSGVVTIDNGTIEATVANASSSVIRISCADSGCTSKEAIGLVVKSGAVIKGTSSYGVTAFGNNDATLDIYGTIESANAALSGNGSYSGKITMNIYEGAKLTATGDGTTYIDAVAIYQPNDGVLNIYGGTITSKNFAAVEVRAGKANISGGTLKSEASDYACDANANGPTTKGAALAVSQHVTKKDIDVVISGGTFEGKKALAIVNPQNNDTDNVKVTVAKSESLEVSTEVCKAKVSTSTADTYFITLEKAVENAPEGSTITLLDDVDLTAHADDAGYAIRFADNVTLDMNNKTISSRKYGVVYEGNGLTIKNGTFKSNYANKEDKVSYALFIGGGNSTGRKTATETKDWVVTITDVTCEGGINVCSHKVIVEGNSKVNGTNYYALWSQTEGEIVVKGGEFDSTGTSTMSTGQTTDGTPSPYSAGKITIEGGTFKASKKLFRNDTEHISITGGTFHADPSAYVADGYFAKKESDETWTVISRDEIVSGVTISGIAGYEHTLFATADDAYDTIKKVLEEKGGLGEEQKLSDAEFKALFTDVDDSGDAKVVWTIYGKQTLDETNRPYYMTFGRKASHYSKDSVDHHFSKIEFVGGNDSAKLICSKLTFPYEWWGENHKFEVSFKNLVFESSNGDFFSFTLTQGYNDGLVASFENCTFSNGRVGLYNNKANEFTFTKCKFDGKGKSESAIQIQGSETEVTKITITGCEFKNSRGIDIGQATAVAVIEGNTFINCGNQTDDAAKNHHSAIKITRGNTFTISNNTIRDCKGTAIYVRGNGSSDPFKGTLTITNNTISNCTYAFCDLENGEHTLYTLNTSGNTITNTETTKCSCDGVEKDITAYLK